jgi:hypothetical protein
VPFLFTEASLERFRKQLAFVETNFGIKPETPEEGARICAVLDRVHAAMERVVQKKKRKKTDPVGADPFSDTKFTLNLG